MDGYLHYEASPTMTMPGAYAQVGAVLRRARRGGYGLAGASTSEGLIARVQELARRASRVVTMSDPRVIGADAYDQIRTQMALIEQQLASLSTASEGQAGGILDAVEAELASIEGYLVRRTPPDVPAAPPSSSTGTTGMHWAWWAAAVGVAAVAGGVVYFSNPRRRGRRTRRRRRRR